MSNAEQIFRRDLDNVEEALRPWVIDTEHGLFIDSRTAPERLVDLHRDIVSTGYAKGWL